jgi:LysR family transcriptional activator of nhaA
MAGPMVVANAPQHSHQCPRRAYQCGFQRSTPVAGQRSDHDRADAVGLELYLATFVHAAARAVDVRKTHFRARHQPGEAAYREAQAALRYLAQPGAFLIAGFKEHFHEGSPLVETQPNDRMEWRNKKADNSETTLLKKLTMDLIFSYRHLYYFWVVAKEGGIARAAARLGMAVQTVSTQVHALEHSLGYALLKPAGRGLVLTAAGVATLQQADQIFLLGEHLPAAVRDAVSVPVVRLAVGISDGLAKLAVRRLLEPVMQEKNLRLLCHEDEFDDLLGDLALHRFDVVLADQAAPPNPNLKLYSHPLVSSTIAWYAPASLYALARREFPRSLARVPVLLPTPHAAVRALLDRWFERETITPRVVGEFEDSALLKTFGASGMGVFPAAELVHDELTARYHVKRIGRCVGVEEHFFAIGTERKVLHPLVQRLLQEWR